MKATGVWLQNLKRMVQATPPDPTKVYPRFGTVTQVSPLRVRLDGDTDPLAYAPPSLSVNLKVSDRVWCATYGRQVVVVGALGSGGPVLPTVLGASVNLNAITQPGDYYQGANSNAASGANYPAQVAGYLEVFADPTGLNMLWQRYATYRHTALVGGDWVGPTVYVRAFYTGTWSPWRELISDDEVGGVVNSNTWYCKKPNGELICRGYRSWPGMTGTQSYVWTFPVPFVGENPQIVVTENTSVPQSIACSFTAISLTGVTIWHYRSSTTGNSSNFEARGRWK